MDFILSGQREGTELHRSNQSQTSFTTSLMALTTRRVPRTALVSHPDVTNHWICREQWEKLTGKCLPQ